MKLELLFPILSFPSGYGKWRLEAQFKKSHRGSVKSSPGETFATNLEIYVGPVSKRPVRFWVFKLPDIPQKGEIWTALCGDRSKGLWPEDILSGRSPGCIAEKGGFRMDATWRK